MFLIKKYLLKWILGPSLKLIIVPFIIFYTIAWVALSPIIIFFIFFFSYTKESFIENMKSTYENVFNAFDEWSSGNIYTRWFDFFIESFEK